MKAGWGGFIDGLAWLGASPRRALVLAGAVFAVVLLGGDLLIGFQVERELRRTREALTSVASAEAGALALRIDGAVSASYSLAALIRQNGYEINPDALAGFAHALLRVQPGISSLQVAPAGVLRFIEPLEGNEAALGVDLFTHPFHGPIVREIVRTRQLTLVGPFELAQGGTGVVARLPVFFARDTGDRFWGFTQVLIRMPELLAGTRLDDLAAGGTAWRLRRDAEPRGFAGTSVVPADPVIASVPVPGGAWFLELAPAAGWAASAGANGRAAWALVLLIGSITAAFAYAVVRQPARLVREVERRTAALAVTTERLDLALEAAELGLWDWSVATDRVEFNDRWRRIVSAPSLAALPAHLGDWWPRVHADDQAALRQAATEQLQGTSEYFQVDFRLRDWRDQWIWIRSRGRVVERDDRGQPLRAAGTNRDITAQRALDEQLRLKSTALEVAANAVVITDATGAIEWVNPAFTRFTGYAAEEVVGQNPRILKSGAHDDALYRDLWATIAAGEVWHGEMLNRRKDGSLYHEIQTITPVADPDGTIRHYLTIKRDVTERRTAEAALRERERLLDAFFSQSFDGFFFMMLDEPLAADADLDSDSAIDRFLNRQRVTRVNTSMLEQYGASEADFLDRPLADFFAHDPAAGWSVAHELLTRGRLHVETDERRLNGSAMRVEGDYTLLRDEQGRIVGHFGVQRDVTERHAMQAELTRMAQTDLLTGLPNRRHLMERLEQDFARFRRAGADAAVLMLDLDHFKRVNDNHGHAAGDAVLRAFADAVRASLRKTDTAGRLGGEEFAVLLHGTGAAGAHVFAERLRRRIEAMTIPVGSETLQVTVSAGVALFASNDASAETTLARADAALYRAKASGRNRVEVDARTIASS